MDDRERQVKAEVERVANLMRRFAERSYEQADEIGVSNFRFDTIGIVAIATFENSENETTDSAMAAFETSKRYVKTGILVEVLTALVSE